MPLPVTRTKIVKPQRRSEILSRPRLLDLFYELLDNKLILVAAPAGFGKTSLLVDFADQADLPVCWYAIDELDADPYRFAAHLIASIHDRFPEFGEESGAALESLAGQSMGNLVPYLVNDAFEHIREHFLLVLDDFHLINENKEIERFLNRFLQDVGENCHVVISSRTLISLAGMPLMVARSQVGGLSHAELAFRADEIQTLILKNYHISMPAEAARNLEEETGGWITGLLLSAHTMWEGLADRLRVARVSGVDLYDYLAQQVLDQQPERIRGFLLKSSLLGEFDADLCRAVFGPGEEWAEYIDFILKSNLFVTPIGDLGRWIRYHHLFSNFLQDRMQREQPEETEKTFRRLAEVYRERGDWEQVYQTLRRMGDHAAISDLVGEIGSDLLKEGRIALLKEWIEALPPSEVNSHPRIQSLLGTILFTEGKQDEGLILLGKAANTQHSGEDLAGFVTTLHRQASALRMVGKFNDALRKAGEARRLAEEDPALLASEATAIREIGVNHYHQGNLKVAIESLDRALRIFETLDDSQSAALVKMELGLAYAEQGEYRKALSNYLQVLEYWRSRQNPIQQAPLLNNMGVLYHTIGEYAQANHYFEQALQYARKNHVARMEAYILAGIGDLYTDLEAYPAAHQAYATAIELSHDLNDRYLQFYLLVSEAKLAIREGRFDAAERLLKQAEAEGEENENNSGYNQGMWLHTRGMLLLEQGNARQAADCLASTVERFSERSRTIETIRSLLYLASAQFLAKEEKTAHETLEQAFGSLDDEGSLPAFAADAARTRAVLEAAEGLEPAQKLLLHLKRFERQLPQIRREIRDQFTTITFVAPHLSITTFGKAQVELDGEAVTAPEWHNQKRVREFFFCVLTYPDGLTKEKIGAFFWPDISPGELKFKFKNLIYKLRRGLGGDVVLFDDARYWFNRQMDYDWDAEKFLALLEKGSTSSSVEARIDAFSEIVELYKGPYLPEIEGSWVEENREFFRQRFLEAGITLARLYLQTGDHEPARALCERILFEDAYNEEAHRLAMRAHAALGNRAAVSRQFEICRQALQREIGVEPSPQTLDLYNLLMD